MLTNVNIKLTHNKIMERENGYHKKMETNRDKTSYNKIEEWASFDKIVKADFKIAKGGIICKH